MATASGMCDLFVDINGQRINPLPFTKLPSDERGSLFLLSVKVL